MISSYSSYLLGADRDTQPSLSGIQHAEQPLRINKENIIQEGTIAGFNRSIRQRGVEQHSCLKIYMHEKHFFLSLRSPDVENDLILGKYGGYDRKNEGATEGNFDRSAPPLHYLCKKIEAQCANKMEAETTEDCVIYCGSNVVAALAGINTAGSASEVLMRGGLPAYLGVAGCSFLFVFPEVGGAIRPYKWKGFIEEEDGFLTANGCEIQELPGIEFCLTDKQTAHLRRWLEANKKSTGEFSYISNNCIQFCQDALWQAGFPGYLADYFDSDWKKESCSTYLEPLVMFKGGHYAEGIKMIALAIYNSNFSDQKWLPDIALEVIESEEKKASELLAECQKRQIALDKLKRSEEILDQIKETIKSLKEKKWLETKKSERYHILVKARVAVNKLSSFIADERSYISLADTHEKLSELLKQAPDTEVKFGVFEEIEKQLNDIEKALKDEFIQENCETDDENRDQIYARLQKLQAELQSALDGFSTPLDLGLTGFLQ
ncbi:hypothetical protein EOPP23_10330 [Endozoicomonas sp. OPT23]|nr:hypothetical protein [Endozoicomonas sp. OPT23]